jgi:hypothetical protein
MEAESETRAAPPRRLELAPSPRRISQAALCTWALLVAAQLGWLPFSARAWAFRLWPYLPAVGVACGALALALCHARVREAVSQRLRGAGQRLRVLPPAAVEAAALLAFGALAWALRERFLLGDSGILFYSLRDGRAFEFPEVGATWILQWLVGLRTHGIAPLLSLAASSCAAGVLTLWLLLRAARHLAPERLAPAAVLFVLSGGMVRVFAGHIEVYALLLAAASGYVFAALAFLRGRCPASAPAAALGIAIWTHAAAVCLLPSLLLLPRLRSPGHSWGALVLPALRSAALAALPLLAFLLASAWLGDGADVERLAAKTVEVLGGSPDPQARRWWVRGFGGAPSIGTDVVLLSRAQLKYLANAAHLLAPATLPVLAAFALAAPRGFVATPAAAFLGCACIPLVAYAFLLRPFWGPYDWDLFSLTALLLSLLAAHLLSTWLRADALRQLLPWLVGFQLLFVTLPFLLLGVVEGRGEGPFRRGAWKHDLQKPATPPPPHIAPWL